MAPSLVSKLTCEFLGTFLLVFTVGCNVLSGNAVWGGVSIACVLMVAIYAMGGISGANFNPAVSLSLGLLKIMGHPDKGLDLQEMGMYMGVQIAGGVLGAFSYAGLFGDRFVLGPADGYGFLNASLCELLYTFMLCFVVLNVAIAKNATPNDYYGLAIGFVIIAGAYGAGSVSGGCFNPAVAVSIDASSGFKNPIYVLLYVVSELIGAALATVLFFVVRPEEKNGEPSKASALVAEFLGTFILVLTVGLNVLGRSPAAAFSIAASLMSMIYALGDVSGANFNPAVTLAIFISGNMDAAKAGTYMGVQIVAGIAAGFVYCFIQQESFSLRPRNNNSMAHVAIAEIVFTFVLAFVVLCTAVDKKYKSTQMFGLAIGSCVTVGGFAIGGISGGCLNPAVSWGIATSYLFKKNGFVNALAWSAFQFIGAAAAAGVYKFTHAQEPDKEKMTV